MDTYSYIRLGENDLELIHQLRQVFAVAFNDDATWNEQTPSDSYLAKVLAESNCITLVATDDNGQVVGGLVAYVLPKFEQERSEIYLYDLAVASEHRRRGIATRLITELKRIAKNYSATVIFVQADNEDAAAIALYTKLCKNPETEITHFDISA